MDINTLVINQELLITLIQERPVIWDKTSENYKIKRLKYDSWKEVFMQLNPIFQDLSGDDKNNFGQVVMKKWTNMKDNWIKCYKKMNESKSGSGAKKIKKYNYYDEMLFLKKIVKFRKTETSMNEHMNDLGLNNASTDPIQSSIRNEAVNSGKTSAAQMVKKKNKNNTQLSEVDVKFMKYMDSTTQEERSRSMNFFRGISDTVDKFSDENMIDFQFQVISIIKNIQQREQNLEPTPLEPTPRNQWDHGYQGYQSSTAQANSQLLMYGYSTAARPGFGTSRQEFDFGHSSNLEPIPNRPESQISVHSVNAESSSANSQASTEETFDFSTEFQQPL